MVYGATVGRAAELLHGKTSAGRARRHRRAGRAAAARSPPPATTRWPSCPPTVPGRAGGHRPHRQRRGDGRAAPRPAAVRRAVPPRVGAHPGRAPAARQLARGVRRRRRGQRSAASARCADAEGVARAVAATRCRHASGAASATAAGRRSVGCDRVVGGRGRSWSAAARWWSAAGSGPRLGHRHDHLGALGRLVPALALCCDDGALGRVLSSWARPGLRPASARTSRASVGLAGHVGHR